jgi:hypothetical protein
MRLVLDREAGAGRGRTGNQVPAPFSIRTWIGPVNAHVDWRFNAHMEWPFNAQMEWPFYRPWAGGSIYAWAGGSIYAWAGGSICAWAGGSLRVSPSIRGRGRLLRSALGGRLGGVGGPVLGG